MNTDLSTEHPKYLLKGVKFIFVDSGLAASPRPRNDVYSEPVLLPDAEIAEDNVEEIFDLDGAGDAAEAA